MVTDWSREGDLCSPTTHLPMSPLVGLRFGSTTDPTYGVK